MDFEGAFFNTSDFRLLTNEKLGEGSFGTVYITERKSDKKRFAAKIIASKGLMKGRDQEKFLLEAGILHKLHHPGIVKFYGVNLHSFDNPSVFEPIILTEYLPRGSLQKVLDEEREETADPNWNPTKKYICLIGIAHAMQYLHLNRIIHRDLKPLNVLIDEQFYPYVCDFGLSRCFTKEITGDMMEMTGMIGSPSYMAPELFEQNAVYGSSVDVYAFAITAYQIVTGRFPYSEPSIYQLIMKVTGGKRPNFNSNVSDKMKALISRCWSGNPYERPSFAEIFNLLANDFSYSKEKVDETEVKNYIKMLKDSIQVEIVDNHEKFALSSLLFNTKNLVVEEKVGEGIVGEFYRVSQPGEYGGEATKYTMKVMKNMNNLKVQRIFFESIEIQAIMKHNAVLQVAGFSLPLENDKYATLFEFAPNGSLFNLLKQVKDGKPPNDWETIKATIIFGTAAGMAFIHQNDVVLGDLRNKTIYLDSNYRPKIGGFVNAIRLKKGASSHNRSPMNGIKPYMAPEIVGNENIPYDHKIDVFAYAMVLYSIVTLKDLPAVQVEKGQRPKFDENEIPKPFADLIKSCWSADPESRPSFLSIVQRFMVDKDIFFDPNLVNDQFKDYVKVATKDLIFW